MYTIPKPDNYILVEGGLVQNNPGLPVFDMDVISDIPRTDEISEATDLAVEMQKHDAKALKGCIDRIREYVANYGDDEELELFDSLVYGG